MLQIGDMSAYTVTATLCPESGLWFLADSEGTTLPHGEDCLQDAAEAIWEWHAPCLVREISRTATRAVFAVDDARFFTLPGLGGVGFLGFDSGEAWNGYACPRFRPETAAEIVSALREAGHTEFTAPAPGVDGLCSFPGFCWTPAEWGIPGVDFDTEEQHRFDARA